MAGPYIKTEKKEIKYKIEKEKRAKYLYNYRELLILQKNSGYNSSHIPDFTPKIRI